MVAVRGQGAAHIMSPGDGSQTEPTTHTIVASAWAVQSRPITKVEFYVDAGKIGNTSQSLIRYTGWRRSECTSYGAATTR